MSVPSCPRCQGLVANLYDDPHCLNCGWRRCEPVQLHQIEREVVEYMRNGKAYRRTNFTRTKKGAA